MAVSCRAQTAGCTDPLANNYDPAATSNDGSCTYNSISIAPKLTFPLSDSVHETSGLMIWDNLAWTSNDHLDTKLYGLNYTTGGIDRVIELTGVENGDWESISQDELFIYVGDFGNNSTGNRTDLHLLRIGKGLLENGNPQIDTIWFSYSDQVSMEPVANDSTDFDCEAFVVTEDSIYLFTKQWVSGGTSLYVLPKEPGTYEARLVETFNIQGLVTGAAYLASKNMLVLCGYTTLLSPFFYAFYDFNGTDFFSGNKRRINVSLPFHQIEAIASINGIEYYVTNESFTYLSVINTPQMLHVFNLEELLGPYVNHLGKVEKDAEEEVHAYPNPAKNRITIESSGALLPLTYRIVDMAGNEMISGLLKTQNVALDISNLPLGVYLLGSVSVSGIKNNLKLVKIE